MIDAQTRFQDLRLRYARSLGRKRDAVAWAWQKFAATPDQDPLRRELHVQIHKLSGSAFAYGYESLGATARTADHLLRQWEETAADTREPGWALVEQLGRPLQSLLADLDAQSAIAAGSRPAFEQTLRVLLVESDPGQAMLVGAQLEARGCAVRFESDPATLWQTLTLWPCHAIVIDALRDRATATELAAQLREQPAFAHLAVVGFCDASADLAATLALHAGCDAGLPKSAGPEALLAQIRACVARTDRSGLDFD